MSNVLAFLIRVRKIVLFHARAPIVTLSQSMTDEHKEIQTRQTYCMLRSAVSFSPFIFLCFNPPLYRIKQTMITQQLLNLTNLCTDT
jgi:hypothetical protein